MIIRQKGYTGSDTTIRNYRFRSKKLIHDIYKNSKTSPITTILIERSQLLKLLYKPISKVKYLSVKLVNKVNEKYTIFKEIIAIVNAFRKILKTKAISELDEWMERASSLKNKHINSFMSGLTRDIAAVKNAIIYQYNNGLAEGSVNKLKVIRRCRFMVVQPTGREFFVNLFCYRIRV